MSKAIAQLPYSIIITAVTLIGVLRAANFTALLLIATALDVALPPLA